MQLVAKDAKQNTMRLCSSYSKFGKEQNRKENICHLVLKNKTKVVVNPATPKSKGGTTYRFQKN